MSKLLKTSTYTLNNGLRIPINGFGLYKTEQSKASEIVYEALKVGYRHFDTARLYGNEEETANGIASFLKDTPSLNRSDVYYTTKLWTSDHGYANAKTAIENSLERANAIDYIDLFLIHAPVTNKRLRLETYKALQEAVKSGKVKSIGVSNYGVKHLKELLEWDGLEIKPVVNQVELHPWLPRLDIQEYAKRNDILLEAYAPITRGKKFNDPDLKAIAAKHNKTPAEILLRWSFDQGFIVLAKTSTLSRIPENYNVLDNVELDEEDKKTLQKPESYEVLVAWDPTTYEDPEDDNAIKN